MIMKEDLLTNKNILTYEYYTGDLLDYKPSRAFVFYSHDNGYSIEKINFENLYAKDKEIGEERIIAVDTKMSRIRKLADKYLQELVDDEGVDIDEAYLQLPSGEWVEFKNESSGK